MSDVDTTFVSEKFIDLCKKLNIDQAMFHSTTTKNGQAEAYIKFIKLTMRKWFNTNAKSSFIKDQLSARWAVIAMSHHITFQQAN